MFHKLCYCPLAAQPLVVPAILCRPKNWAGVSAARARGELQIGRDVISGPLDLSIWLWQRDAEGNKEKMSGLGDD